MEDAFMKTKLFLWLFFLTVFKIATAAFQPEKIQLGTHASLVPLQLPVKRIKHLEQKSQANQTQSNGLKNKPLPNVKVAQTTKTLPNKVAILDANANTPMHHQQQDIVPLIDLAFTQSTDFQHRRVIKYRKNLSDQEEQKYGQTPETRSQKVKAYVAKHPYKTAAAIVVIGGVITAVIVAYKKGCFKTLEVQAVVSKTKKKKRKKHK